MDFLSNIWNSLKGFVTGKKDNSQSQTSQVTAPQNPIPIQSAPSAPSLSVVPQPVQQPNNSINSVDLVKAQQAPIPVINSAPQSPQPQPSLLQKVVSAIPSAASSALNDTANFGKAIAAPAEGLINTVRDIPALLYGAAGAVTPGHTFKGNIQDFNNVVPHATFADKGVQDLIDSGNFGNPGGNLAKAAQVISKGGEIAGGMALPLPGAPEIEALNGAAPLVKAAINTAIKSGEGAAIGGGFGLAANGDTNEGIKGAELGAGIGAGGSILGSLGGAVLNLFRGAPEAAVPGAENAAAALTAHENPNAGALNNPHGDQTVEDAILAQPALQRAQEAAIQANQLQKAAVAGPRTLSDITGRTVNAQDLHAADAIQEPTPSQVNPQPIGADIKAPVAPPSLSPAEIHDITASTGKFSKVNVTNDTFNQTDGTPEAIAKTNPITKETTISAPALEGDVKTLLSGEPIHTPEGEFRAKPGETASQVAERYLKEAVLPYEALHPKNVTIDQAQRMVSGDSKNVAKELDAQALAESAPPSALGQTPAKPEVAPEPALPNAPSSPIGQPTGDLKAPRQADILLSRENVADQAEMKAKLPKAETTNLQAVQDKAAANVDAMGDTKGIASQYQQQPAIKNVEDYYTALQAANKLSGLTDEASKAARTNLYSAITDFQSETGLNLRASQILFSDMPVEMKTSIAIKNMINTLTRQGDDARVNALNDPAKRAAVEAALDNFFTKDRSIQDEMSVARGTLDDPLNHSAQEIDASGKALQDAQGRLADNTNDFAKFRDSEVPAPPTSISDKVNNIQRNSMLSAISGRLRHIVASNIINGPREVVNSAVEGALGKVGNAITDTPGKFIDSSLSPVDTVSGIPGALQKAGKVLKGGDSGYASIEDAMKYTKAHPDATDLTGSAKGPVDRYIKATVGLPSDASQGMQDGQITRLLRQQGQQNGLAGEDLDKFVQAGQYNPPADVLAKGQQLKDTLNNINDNPITDALRATLNGVSKLPGGKLIANALDPFPTYLGGNIWNKITDQNVIANTYKFLSAIKTGDPQVAITNLSKALVGVGETYAGGYLLAKAGVITDKDANGKSYSGAYIHPPGSNTYIPVGFLGALAPNILLGNLYYHATNDGGDPVKTLTNGIKSIASSLDLSGLTGADSSAVKAVTDAAAGNGPKAVGDVVSGIGGEFIPAIGGDINAGLNQTSLNPTHEAADTSSTDPNSSSGSAKDYIGTAINSLANKVPFVSQQLPRIPGEAAQSFVDRVTQGNHSSDTQIQQAATDKATVASSYKNLQDYGVFTPAIRNILDPATQKVYDSIQKGGTASPADVTKLIAGISKGASSTGDSRFLSDGNYDANLTALKVAYDEAKSDPTTKQDTLDKFAAQIARGTVYQKNNVPYPQIEKYQNTTLTEWRNMGDPKKAEYDPKTYQELYTLDQQLAAAGGTKSTDPTKPVFTAKAPVSGSTSADAALKTIQGNRIGSIASINPQSLQKITGHAISSPAIPTIAPVTAANLPQLHKISVGAPIK